jgi:hypothetical protein
MTPNRLADPAAIQHLMKLASADPAGAEQAFPDLRLVQVVAARLDMDVAKAGCFLNESGGASAPLPPHVDAVFHGHLQQTLDRYEPGGLFVGDAPGRHHHAVRPRGYDYSVDSVDSKEMETWRADYRKLSTAQQVLAASIIWLFRRGKDRVWLRRVPCTWRATLALRVLRNHRALSDWGRLIFLFPGW